VFRLEQSHPEEFWRTIFLSLFPEYQNVYDNEIDRDLRTHKNTSNLIRWKAVTLWVTYFHRRILKLLEMKKIITLVRDANDSIDIRFVVFNDKKIPTSVFADLNGCYKGRLLGQEFNWSTENEIGQGQKEKQSKLNKIVRFESVNNTGSAWFKHFNAFDFFVHFASEKPRRYEGDFKLKTMGYPRKDGLLFIGNECKICQNTNDLKLCGGCLDTKYCSVECQKLDFIEHKKSCLK
jgi:hypothetical protein